MLGYIYLTQIDDNIFEISTRPSDIRVYIKSTTIRVYNPDEKKRSLHDILYDHSNGLENDLYRVSNNYLDKLLRLMDIRDVSVKLPRNKLDMKNLFIDGRLIKCKDEIGYYDEDRNSIIYDDKIYKSLSGFAKAIYGYPVNGWDKCYYESEHGWIPVKKMRN